MSPVDDIVDLEMMMMTSRENSDDQGTPPVKKCFLSGIAQITSLPPLPPIRATCTTFLDVKNNVLSRITEPSNDDYDSDGSDNYDYNFLTFDDFGVKSDQKVLHNIILMPKCKGQHGGKKGPKNSGRALPPLFGQCQKENIFLREVLPYNSQQCEAGGTCSVSLRSGETDVSAGIA